MSTASIPFVLPADLNIYEAAALKVGLLEWIQHGERHEIDGSAVTSVDLTGVQVLLMLPAHARRIGAQVRLTAASAVLHDTLQLLGWPLELHTAQ